MTVTTKFTKSVARCWQQRGNELDERIESIFNAGLCATNDVLPESDRKQVLSVLNDAQHELQTLEAEMVQLVNHIVVLNSEHSRRLARINKIKGAVAAHKYLPPEVLSEVFVHCLSQDDSFSPCESAVVYIPPKCSQLGLLPPPWTFGQVSSKWRQIALADTQLWNSIVFEGTEDHLAMLHEVLKRCGRSKIRLVAERCLRNLLQNVILPWSKQFSSLSLSFGNGTTTDAFFLLPAGLFDSLEFVELLIENGTEFQGQGSELAVFQGSPHLQRVSFRKSLRLNKALVPSFPLHLNLPWSQLTHINLHWFETRLVTAHDLLRLSLQLRECCLRLDDEPLSDGRMLVGCSSLSSSRTSILLRHLESIDLDLKWTSKAFLYADFLRPLVLPALTHFKFTLDSDSTADCWSPSELQSIFESTYPTACVELRYNSLCDFNKIVGPLSFLTSIKVLETLTTSSMWLVADDQNFPRLACFSGYVDRSDLDDLLRMFKRRWVYGGQSRSSQHACLRRAKIFVLRHTPEVHAIFEREIHEVTEALGLEDFVVELLPCHKPSFRR